MGLDRVGKNSRDLNLIDDGGIDYMSTRLKNGLWRAQVYVGTDDTGKRIYKSFCARTADEADYAALAYKLGKGKRVDTEDITLRAAVEAYINSKDGVLSPSTIEGYRVILRNFGEYLDTPISRVTTIGLQNAIRAAAGRTKNKSHNGTVGLSPKTLKNYRGLIKRVLKQHGVTVGDIDVPRAIQPEYNTPFEGDLANIFAATKDTKIELPVLLASWCSLRASEILGLQYGDVDEANHILHIRRAKIYVRGKPYVKPPKTRTSARDIYLPDYILNKIKEYSKSVGDNDTYIFNYSTVYLYKTFSRLIERAGLPHCRFHDLRHAFASILTARGVDKKYIQEMGGWATDNVMTRVYTQTDPSRKREIDEMLDGIFSRILPENEALATTMQHHETSKSR